MADDISRVGASTSNTKTRGNEEFEHSTPSYTDPAHTNLGYTPATNLGKNDIGKLGHDDSAQMDPARRIVVEKSLKRKLDARCSVFILIYVLNYLDRNNISAARLK